MRHGSLFSGIGGFDLAAEWMGWQNMFHCEIEDIPKRVLKYYWPEAISYGDIKKTDFTIWRGKLDILTGGFPCQPYSQAGKRKGKDDDRHLWPEMLRAIREIKPTWIVGENVRGLITWKDEQGQTGVVFDEVQADLEAAGYSVQPFLLPAAGVNAPHERYRVWIVAYASKTTRPSDFKRGRKKHRQKGSKVRCDTSTISEVGDAPDTTKTRLQGGGKYRLPQLNKVQKTWNITNTPGYDDVWRKFPTISPVCNRDDGVPGGLDGITFPKWRNESIKAMGNAIVPQVALQIFKAIEEYEKGK